MDIRQHLIDHHGVTWQIAKHPSHNEQWCLDYHERMHSDPTAEYLDHEHDDDDA